MNRSLRLRKRTRGALRATGRTVARGLWRASDLVGPRTRPGRALLRAGSAVDARTRALGLWLRGAPEPPPSLDAIDSGYEQLLAVRRRALVRVDRPLALISQLHRSGGTLLMRLFDGHPQLDTVPHELGQLLPARDVPLDVDRAWRLLENPKLVRWYLNGLKQAAPELNSDESALPLLNPTAARREFFDAAAAGSSTERDVVDAYLTAYFNAWLDYGALGGEKRWVVGFEPGALTNRRQMRRFEQMYPDGRVISLVRDPWSWYSSARRWDARFAALDTALTLWEDSVRAAVELRDRDPERVRLVAFDRLVLDTEGTMGELAEFLEIEADPALLEPTFNGRPVGANSSFPTASQAVSPEPATARRELLAEAEREAIDATVGGLYGEVLATLDIGARA